MDLLIRLYQQEATNSTWRQDRIWGCKLIDPISCLDKRIMDILLVLFGIIIIGFLVFDLGYLNRQAHTVSFKSALYQSIFWIATSVIYGILVWSFVGHELAAEFISAYITEKMLSVDNLFVIMLIFTYFKVEPKYQHRVLFWGILGAIVARGIFLTTGIWLVHQFHWILYVFGIFLVYTGVKLFRGDEEEDPDFKENRVYKLATKYLAITSWDIEGRFWVKAKNGILFTNLFLVLLIIETTDILFAFDSIPAVLAISQNPFIVFTSNIFAIMGLRALFFLVQGLLGKFEHLQKGISFVLVFIGLKMLADIINIHISSIVSLAVIILSLGISIWVSLGSRKK